MNDKQNKAIAAFNRVCKGLRAAKVEMVLVTDRAYFCTREDYASSFDEYCEKSNSGATDRWIDCPNFPVTDQINP